MKKLISILILLLIIPIATAEESFDVAKEIISSKTSCSNLNEDQLETIGDYYMEQMHPGEAHEYMDNMMGGEGSESLRQIHVNIARSFYCGESYTMSPMMMNSVMGRPSGMMGGYRMMGYPGYWSTWGIQSLLFYLVVIAITVFIVITIINSQNKRKR